VLPTAYGSHAGARQISQASLPCAHLHRPKGENSIAQGFSRLQPWEGCTPKTIALKADGETSAFRSTRRSTSTRNNLSFRARRRARARSVGLLQRKRNPIPPVTILFHRSDGFRAISLCVSFPGPKPWAVLCSPFRRLKHAQEHLQTAAVASGSAALFLPAGRHHFPDLIAHKSLEIRERCWLWHFLFSH